MASHSPQLRALNRRSHGQNGPAAMLSTQQQREMSPSPTHRERPRTTKTHSMPLVPSVQQIFAGTGSGPPTLVQQQSSPTLSNLGAPPGRMLPIPPDQQSAQNGQDHGDIPDRRPSSSPGPQYPISQNPVNPMYARPIPRQPNAFLNQFSGPESEQRLTEVFADIERADQQQAQGQFAPSNTYTSPYGPPVHPGTPSPPKDHNVERLRGVERASPNQPDPRRQREQTQARESPQAQNRQPHSPSYTAQTGLASPERRASPVADTASVYQREYGARDSPTAPKRPNVGTDPRAATFTPPEQNIARTPDRSLPFQEVHEEAEDDHYPVRSKPRWQGEDLRHGSSPTPSSDLNPDGNNIRYDHSQNQPSRQSDLKNSSKGLSSEDDSGTPRSPSVALPPADKYYHAQHSQARLSPKNTIRVKTRNGSTDGLGLRSLTPSAFESPSSTMLTTSSQSSAYADISQIHESQKPRSSVPSPNQQSYQNSQPSSRSQTQYQQPQQDYQQRQPQPQDNQSRPSQPASQGQQPQTHQPQAQKPQDQGEGSNHPAPTPDSTRGGQYAYPGYGPPQVYPDDFQNHTDDGGNHYGYWQPYFVSPRPDAPIPPTPHSQSAAPSPSPFPGAYGMMYSPIAPVGSPYPYPFGHIPRVPMGDPGRSQPPSNMNPNSRSALLRQEALHMRNYLENDIRANMTDTSSVISPASTPFQGANYDPYAYVHTKFLRQAMDTMSIRSSPSHEPVPLPPAPMLRQRKPSGLRKSVVPPRKPPPRVDSTIPRETTPEPVSSGEETAGEEHSVVNGATSNLPVNGIGLHHSSKSTVWDQSIAKEEEEEDTEVQVDDNSGDWIDEDEDPDDDDMLDLEYHPNYVVNSDKRRRRWEVGWDAVVQAFQSLDRQTDATMVLMAAPAHSSKLYSVRSRSIRRTPTLANSANLRAMRSNFKNVSGKRKDLRPIKALTLAEKLRESQSSSGEGSDGSSETKTEDLRSALDTAVRGLNYLNDMFAVRESKLQEELKKMQEDKERMGLVLQQLIGDDRLSGRLTV